MKKAYTLLLVALGVAFILLAIYYLKTEAGLLPHWLPGYEAGSVHKHTKHGAASAILGVGCFVWAWFASGSKPEHKPKSEQNTETE